MKKEILEKAAERYVNMQEDVSETIGKYLVKAVFKDGAYWNQERSYSEQDMIDFAYKYIDERRDQGARALTPELLIKQFKKK